MKPDVFARAAPQSHIEENNTHGHALVSITGTGMPKARIEESRWPGGIHKMVFDDIPWPIWTDPNGKTWNGPKEEHVQSVLEFIRKGLPNTRSVDIIVHCYKGKSRSAAIALAIMADQLGPGGEEEAVRRLLQHDHAQKICCNPGIIAITDNLLQRQGAIERALRRACPPFNTWKNYWMKKQNKEAFDGREDPLSSIHRSHTTPGS